MSNSEFSLAGREVSPVTSLVFTVTTALSVLSGAAIAITSLTPGHIWPWHSASYLTQLLIGIALVAVAPALIAVVRATLWENIPILVFAVAVIVIGLAVVSIVGPFVLHTSTSSGIITFMWLVGIVALALLMPVALIAQSREPGLPLPYSTTFPRWSIPLIALLGSAHFGLGLGLLGAPGFWSKVVPWKVNATDANALGVWCLGIGIGLLYAIAENDLLRARIGSLAMLCLGAGEIVAYALGASQVTWASWAGLSAIGLAIWLFFTGLVGLLLAKTAEPLNLEPSEQPA